MSSPFLQPPPERPSRKAVVVIVLGIAAVFLLIIWAVTRKGTPRLFKPSEPPVIVTTGTVQENDVFSLMLAKQGLDKKYVQPVYKSLKQKFAPERIHPGNHYEIVTSTFGLFKRFTYWTDFPVQGYIVTRSSMDAYSISDIQQKTIWKEKRVRVEVTKFLDYDLRAAGYDATLIDNLMSDLVDRIFGWRVDFFTEQRKGDTLDVLLEEEYLPGEDHPIKGGKHMRVIIASYTGSGTKNKENYAVRYQTPNAKQADFFDQEGRAMQRQFLRAPFTKGAFRVSSGFNNHRFHPILRIYRPHHGTDYAASIGTPVAAIGNGTVVRAEWYKGYGNCVDVRHNGRYTSRYGHLSYIAVHRGQSIAQGQYLGKVGNTGLSTGPHLHFEMLVDGAQQNFLRMSFPAASSVSKENMAEFGRVRDEEMRRLKQITMNVNH